MGRPSNAQLQIFALVRFVYGLASLLNLYSTCSVLTGTGTCQPTEIYLLSCIGLVLLFVAVAFSVLTTIAYDDWGKKRRLAFVAMHCVSAQLAGAVLAGSAVMGGIMPKGVHIAEIAVQLALFLILATAVWGGGDGGGGAESSVLIAGRVRGGIGINPKTFNVLFALLMVASIFINSDVMTYDMVLGQAVADSITDTAKFWWSAYGVYVFELFLLYGFGVTYGTHDDNDFLTGLAVVFTAGELLQTYWFEPLLTEQYVKNVLISSCVIIGIGILAMAVYRNKRHRDYESLVGLVR